MCKLGIYYRLTRQQVNRLDLTLANSKFLSFRSVGDPHDLSRHLLKGSLQRFSRSPNNVPVSSKSGGEDNFRRHENRNIYGHQMNNASYTTEEQGGQRHQENLHNYHTPLGQQSPALPPSSFDTEYPLIKGELKRPSNLFPGIRRRLLSRQVRCSSLSFTVVFSMRL